MNKDDKDEVREMFTDVIRGEVSERLSVIQVHLTRVEMTLNETKNHAKETNGKVANNILEIEKLKEQNLVHYVNCPNTEDITTLKNKNNERRAILLFLGKAIMMMSVTVGIWYTLIKIFES